MFKFLAGTIFGMFLPFLLAGAWAGSAAWSFKFFSDHFGKVALFLLLLIFLPILIGKKKQKKSQLAS